MNPDRDHAFMDAMLNTYREALKLGYNARIFLQMIGEHGAAEAAKRLVSDPQFSAGFDRLWQLNRLDLAGEALILQPDFEELFGEEERQAAREKLARLGYTVTG